MKYLLLRGETAVVEEPVNTDIKNVVIPKQIEYDSHTYKVTAIGDNAFANCNSLTSISIPKSVTSIGSEVFSGCSSLTSIRIPEGVTAIDRWTFSRCSSLTSIRIPKGVTTIGYEAFYGCPSLKTIYCHAPVPVEYTMWEIYDCAIYVPDESVEVYKAAEWWEEQNILPMSQASKKH